MVMESTSVMLTMRLEVFPMSELPPSAYLIALASLPAIGPQRLRQLCADRDFEKTWSALQQNCWQPLESASREIPLDVINEWHQFSAQFSVSQSWQRHCELGVDIITIDDENFPALLRDDPTAPFVLFVKGSLAVFSMPRVAIVGTRKSSAYGISVATRFGKELSHIGISVVSGLALGIDGAAHLGALQVAGAPPLAIVGSGIDCIYPPSHKNLWNDICARGLVLSEHPCGRAARAWHFPARNRLIAALSDVVLVVESHDKGGALLTAVEAAQRGVPVMAVPGPITAPSSDGTNQLLYDGCSPVRDVDDILIALGYSLRVGKKHDDRKVPSSEDEVVLSHIPWTPIALSTLADATDYSLVELAMALDRLEQAGWIRRIGSLIERRGAE